MGERRTTAMHDHMDTGTPSTGGQRAADTWATNPLNPHRIRDSRLAAEAELFRELEEQAGADAELRSAFRAARRFAEDLQAARKEFCRAAPPGTLIERELLGLERLSPWGGDPGFDARRYLAVLSADRTPLERARAAYLRALAAAHETYAAAMRSL